MSITKIEHLLIDTSNVFEKQDKRDVKIKSVIDSCKTLEQLENCKEIISASKRMMETSINTIMKQYGFLNWLPFKNVEKTFKNEIDKRISNLLVYYSIKLKSISNE